MSYRRANDYILQTADYTQEVGVDFGKYNLEELKELWRATMEKGMHGLCFSMYEDGQTPGDTISEKQVERRVKILKPYVSWIRSFSCIEGNEHIPVHAKKQGIKTMVGAWLSDDKEDNEREISGMIELGKKGMIDIAAVGNEVLYRDDLSLEELIGYIKRVKEALPGVTVGYVDAYYEFSVHPELVEISDVILANCYPYWEGCP